MPSIKKEQILKINNACSNDWQLNMFYYATHQVKTLIKRIRIDSQNFLEFELCYNSQNQVSLKIRKYYHEVNETLAVTSGAYKTIILDETSAKRKNVNNLIPFTRNLNNDKLLELS